MIEFHFLGNTVESRFKKDFGCEQILSYLKHKKPLKKQYKHLKQYKYFIALTLSNASDYIFRYLNPFQLKLGKYGFFF